jgi:hypothetical protein
MSAKTRLRSFAAAIMASDQTRRRTSDLERDHRMLLATVHELQEQMGSVHRSIERMHQTLADADPQLSLEIVTQVRDDVRALMIDVTEQLNLDAGAPRSTVADSPEATAPQG